MWDNTGSVAVTVALILTLLLGVMAFSMDTGYLYLKKNQHQNAVEAAAMAGALSLCNENPKNVARKIAIENIPGLESELEEEEAVLTIQVGFYDENDTYADFSTYKDFVASDDSAFPDGEYNNAIMVRLSIEDKPLTGNILSDSITITAAAVAYRQGYGLLSYGDASQNGINIQRNWPLDDPPQLERLGRVHSNGDIYCEIEPVVDADTIPTANGAVTNMPEAVSAWPITVEMAPIDWDELLANAEENGRVITVSDFPERGSGDYYEDRIEGPLGNWYYPRSTNGAIPYGFVLHDGDHGGAVYYITDDSSSSSDNINFGVNTGNTASNLTLASELPLNIISSNTEGNGGVLGGNGTDIVYVYCREDIGGNLNHRNSLVRHSGVIYRTEKDFSANFFGSHASPTSYTYYMRATAGGLINIQGHRASSTQTSETVIINGAFGPPCGSAEVVLGRLK